jgi:putative endonuclease
VRQHRERRTLTPQAALGRKGEDLAHRYLRSCGYRVIARNYKPGPDSEIDIVAREGNTLVFLEVKSRLSSEFSAPERAIDAEKQKRIMKAARSFISRSGDAWNNVRFDTISVVFSHPPAIAHYKDVFFEARALDMKAKTNP